MRSNNLIDLCALIILPLSQFFWKLEDSKSILLISYLHSLLCLQVCLNDIKSNLAFLLLNSITSDLTKGLVETKTFYLHLLHF